MAKKGHKHAEIVELAADTHPRVIAVTESHLDDSFRDGEIAIPGYQMIRQDRDPGACKKKKGGGVIAYVQEGLDVDRISRQAGEDFELVAFDLPGKM
eukprot:gene57246-biopygen107523